MMQGTTARLGANHGYRFEGDQAFLNADLSFAREFAGEGWALQLWACDAPYQGGPLRGIKVAEAALDGASERLEANALALLPPMQRDYAMVLVLAADGQVHDFSNYPTRQTFAGPHLTGSVGYTFEGEQVALQASVRNPRAAGNLSGTLALQLWALSERYEGGALDGHLLAQAEIGCLGGEQEGAQWLHVARTEAPAGAWQLALVLREWTEAGYQTRDYCSFPAPYRVEAAVRVVNAPVAVGDKPAKAVEAKAVELKAVEPVEVAKPAQVVEPAKVVEQPKLALKALADTRVSVSNASVEELAVVRGLTLKLAQGIVRARPFESVDDLTRVRGIGAKLLAKVRGQLTP